MDDHRQKESLSFEKVSKKLKRSRYLTWSTDNPLLVGGFVSIVLISIILIIGSNFDTHTGIIEKTDIGTIAEHDYKAPRDFTFDSVDREATERSREQRVSKVLPIYRWEKSYRDSALAHIRNAFEKMRQGLSDENNHIQTLRISNDSDKLMAQGSPEWQHWAASLLTQFRDDPLFEEYV